MKDKIVIGISYVARSDHVHPPKHEIALFELAESGLSEEEIIKQIRLIRTKNILEK